MDNIKEYFSKVWSVFRSPTSFFESVASESGYKKAMWFFVITTFLVALFSDVLPALIGGAFDEVGMALGLLAITIPVSVIFLFAVAGLYQFVAELLKGQGEYEDTFRVFGYSAGISLIYTVLAVVLGLVLTFVVLGTSSEMVAIGVMLTGAVIIGIVSGVHTFVVEIIGLAMYHKITKLRAFVISIVPVTVLLLLILIGLVALYGVIPLEMLLPGGFNGLSEGFEPDDFYLGEGLSEGDLAITAGITAEEALECVDTGRDMDADTCLTYLAGAKEDGSYCEKITDEFFSEWCYSDAALASGNRELCASLPFATRGACELQVDVSVQGAPVCETYPDDWKDTCYQQAAENIGVVEICEKVSTKPAEAFSMLTGESAVTTARNICYQSLASIMNDDTICDKITVPEHVEICKS